MCVFVSAYRDITSSQSEKGQRGAAGHLDGDREREVADEREEEERRPCLKRAVEINQYVYILEEQSVPLAEEHSTVRFPPDCFLLDPFVSVSFFFC